MSSSMYSDIVEKINSLETKIQHLERVFAAVDEKDNFTLYKNEKSAHYLINFTRNLKRDIIQKPLRYDSDEKILSQMYNKVCDLESELENLLQSKQMQKQLFTPYTNYNESPKQLRVKQNTGKCAPHEVCFDQLSIQSKNSLQEVVSTTSSTDEMICYDLSPSSSTISSTTLIVEEIGSTEQFKVVYSSDSEIFPVYVRKSRRKPKHCNNKKIKFENSYTDQKNKDLSNISPQKQQNLQNHITDQKSTKQQRRLNRKSTSRKFDVNKSKLSNIPKQETEIFFVKKQKPTLFADDGSINNNEHKEKYLITRLKRVNTPIVREFHNSNNPQNVNPSQPIQSRDFEVKPPRNKSSRYRSGGNFVNPSDYSIESQYIKAKWKRSPQEKTDKIKSKINFTSSPVIVASDSKGFSDRFPHKRPVQYVYSAAIPRYSTNLSGDRSNRKNYPPNGQNNKHRKKRERFGSSKTGEDLTCLNSSNMSFANRNHEIVGSFYKTDTCPVSGKTHNIALPRSHGASYSQKYPITVYSLTNESPVKSVRFHYLRPDDVLLNEGTYKLISNSKTNVPKKQLDSCQLLTQESHLLKNRNNSLHKVGKQTNYFPKSEDQDEGSKVPVDFNEISALRTQNKNTMNDPIAHSIYVTTIPVFQENSQKPSLGPISHQTNGLYLPDTNNYSSISEGQVEILAKKLSPILTKVIASSLNPNPGKHSNIEPLTVKNISDLSNKNVNQFETESTTSLYDNEKKTDNLFSLAHGHIQQLDTKINTPFSEELSVKEKLNSTQLPQLKTTSNKQIVSRHSMVNQKLKSELAKNNSKKRFSTGKKSKPSNPPLQSHIESTESKSSLNEKPSVTSVTRFFLPKTLNKGRASDKEQNNTRAFGLSTILSVSEPTNFSQCKNGSNIISFDKAEEDMTEITKPASVTPSVKNLSSHKLLSKSIPSDNPSSKRGSQAIHHKLIPDEIVRNSTTDEVENIHTTFNQRSVSGVLGEMEDFDSNSAVFNNYLGESNIELTRPFSIKDGTRPSAKSAAYKERIITQKPNISTEENKKNSLRNNKKHKQLNSSKNSSAVSIANIPTEASLDSKRKSSKLTSNLVHRKIMQDKPPKSSTIDEVEIHGAFNPRSVSGVLEEMEDLDCNSAVFNNYLGESNIELTRPFSIKDRARPSARSAAFKERIITQKPNISTEENKKPNLRNHQGQLNYANKSSTVSMKKLFSRKIFPKYISSEKSLNNKRKSSKLASQIVNHKIIRGELTKDSTIDELENIHGKYRSISGLLGEIGDSDTTYSLFKNFQGDSSSHKLKPFSIKDSKSYPSSKSATTEEKTSRQPINLPEENKISLNYNQDHKQLKYSIHLTKEKRMNVELSSVPSTLSIRDILPSNYRKLLSMEEIMLSEHRLNGIQLHAREHNLVVHPSRSEEKHYLFHPKRNLQKSNDENHGKFLPNIKNPDYTKNIPITLSNQLSNSSNTIDWRKVVHEIKECQ